MTVGLLWQTVKLILSANASSKLCKTFLSCLNSLNWTFILWRFAKRRDVLSNLESLLNRFGLCLIIGQVGGTGWPARWRRGDVLGNWVSRGQQPVMTTLDGAWIHKWDNLDKLGIAQMSTIPAFLCGKRQIYLGYQTTWTLEWPKLSVLNDNRNTFTEIEKNEEAVL